MGSSRSVGTRNAKIELASAVAVLGWTVTWAEAELEDSSSAVAAPRVAIPLKRDRLTIDICMTGVVFLPSAKAARQKRSPAGQVKAPARTWWIDSEPKRLLSPARREIDRSCALAYRHGTLERPEPLRTQAADRDGSGEQPDKGHAVDGRDR